MTATNLIQNGRYAVLGFPRSGTTLLGKLLGAHPQISCPPETNILNSCGRFLREESRTEGPPIGVLSGLELADIDPDIALDALRQLFFTIQDKSANRATVKVEKSGFDIFYIDEIELLLKEHCRFICLTRNPFDVVVSVKELMDTIGIVLPEFQVYAQTIPNQHEAFAQAWVDCTERMVKFIAANPENCFSLKYEDLVAEPLQSMQKITDFMGLEEYQGKDLENAFNADSQIGLGDWKIYESDKVENDRTDRWRKILGRNSSISWL